MCGRLDRIVTGALLFTELIVLRLALVSMCSILLCLLWASLQSPRKWVRALGGKGLVVRSGLTRPVLRRCMLVCS